MEKSENKIVVLTGGAGLIGSSISRNIIKNGNIVIIADLNECKAKEVCNEINLSIREGNADFKGLDITSKDSISNLVEYILEKYGKIDVLINNAYPRNSNYGRKFEDVEYNDFCENVNLHLGGYFLASQQFAEFFKKQGFGNIINISSIYGVVPPKFEIYNATEMTMPVEYAAIKSSVIHLTKYMAKYYKGCNIRFNAISIGGILNKQDKKFINQYNEICLNKGMLEVNDIYGVISFLISEDSKYINGQNIIIDDGFTL